MEVEKRVTWERKLKAYRLQKEKNPLPDRLPLLCEALSL